MKSGIIGTVPRRTDSDDGPTHSPPPPQLPPNDGVFQGSSYFTGLGLLPSLALPSLGTHRDLEGSGAQHVASRTLVMCGVRFTSSWPVDAPQRVRLYILPTLL